MLFTSRQFSELPAALSMPSLTDKTDNSSDKACQSCDEPVMPLQRSQIRQQGV